MIQFQEIDLKSFLNDYWQKKPLLLRNALPEFETPVSPEELAGLSLEEEIESRIVIQHGKENYELKRGPFSEEDYASLPEQNWTLLVQGCDRLLPEVADILNDFDFLPRWRIDDIMISYAATGGNVGPHFDHYDVFLLQASGQRRWYITSQDCHEDNYIQGVDLRLMQTFKVEEEFVLNPGDILYLPPKVGHHGVALDDQCMTFSVGYRSYRGQELWDSLGDHLSEMSLFKELYYDPQMPTSLNPGEVTKEAALQAKKLLLEKLEDETLLQTWFARFATQLDQSAAQQLPEPLTEEETPALQEFIDALYGEHGLIKDAVCRFAFTEIDGKTQLYINGSIWKDFDAPGEFIQRLANNSFLDQEALSSYLAEQSVQELLFDLWKAQYLIFIE
ncbi:MULTISPECIES: cupin domain-containing protein [Thiomicrorhabdus]|uniref:Cupin domain-containing protein n=1 Tax=Thiomicrorhabdus heinhorstiae TaxID=2748010 RepID=A0ABS0BUF0_9GAMM|nr:MULTISPECIES: cupin domain-containing protein [Thiomicrorhabdus]MBF6056949.1 cupin domain-containing protein [Thiomicrorhabdus heinhorstiae]